MQHRMKAFTECPKHSVMSPYCGDRSPHAGAPEIKAESRRHLLMDDPCRDPWHIAGAALDSAIKGAATNGGRLFI
jgi:hypothetical protein